jgi:predicted phage tail protein
VNSRLSRSELRGAFNPDAPLPPLPEGPGPSAWSGDETPLVRATLRTPGTIEPTVDHADRRVDEIGDVLRAAHDVAEAIARVRREELERLDEAQRACDEHVKVVEAEAAAMVAAAKLEAARLSTTMRAEAESRLGALVSAQESLGNELLESSHEMRRTITSAASAGS